MSIPANKITGDMEITAEGVKQTNIISDTYKTGDNNNLFLWFILASIGIIIMLLTAFVKTERR